MYKNNASLVQRRRLNCNINDISSRERHVDMILEKRIAADYRSSSPLISARELYPQLKSWHEGLADSDTRYALVAGSIGLEATVGAPHQKVRRSLIAQTRQRLGDTGLDGVRRPADDLIRKHRMLGVVGILATRSLTSKTYTSSLHEALGHLDAARRAADAEADYASLGLFTGALMEQTVLCLLHDPEQGIIAVPSFLRQDMNTWHEGGKKYRWDVTAESNGTRIPAGQYRIQAKNNASYEDLNSYHPDIVMISGAQHMDGNPNIGAFRCAAESILDQDSAAVAGTRIRS